jgi:Amidohydrolase family
MTIASNSKSVGRIPTLICITLVLLGGSLARAQSEDVPDRPGGEGLGQFERLVLRGAYLIDGSGAPAQGPVDIVVTRDRISEMKVVGVPGVAIRAEGRPDKGDYELDLGGQYILPGFIDLHSHIHALGSDQNVPPEYIFKLQMAHGITSIRELGNDKPVAWIADLSRRSRMNQIVAPRITPYPYFRLDNDKGIDTPEDARKEIRRLAKGGAEGIKFFGAPAEILWAALDEANKLGLPTTMHHAQLDVMHANVLDTSSHGLGSMEHWYGLPEAMFTDKRIQDYPVDYIYQNEQHRFGEAGRLWKQAAPPYSDKWNEVMNTLLGRGFALIPTFTAYLTSRDFMRMSRAIWHDEYTLPALWDYYRPNRDAHGSFWFYWTTEDEMAWKENFRLWMTFVNEYKNRGGKVGLGSDTGYLYNLYGFGYVQEMELMREAGFSPLEVIHAATLVGAEILHKESDVGSIQVGKKADFVIVEHNPLENLKVLFGTGTIRLNDETGRVERIGGVRWTIKDGIIYDARELRADVREMVRAAKEAAGIPPGPMPIANAGAASAEAAP